MEEDLSSFGVQIFFLFLLLFSFGVVGQVVFFVVVFHPVGQ